jgi:hypothetical protein
MHRMIGSQHLPFRSAPCAWPRSLRPSRITCVMRAVVHRSTPSIHSTRITRAARLAVVHRSCTAASRAGTMHEHCTGICIVPRRLGTMHEHGASALPALHRRLQASGQDAAGAALWRGRMLDGRAAAPLSGDHHGLRTLLPAPQHTAVHRAQVARARTGAQPATAWPHSGCAPGGSRCSGCGCDATRPACHATIDCASCMQGRCRPAAAAGAAVRSSSAAAAACRRGALLRAACMFAQVAMCQAPALPLAHPARTGTVSNSVHPLKLTLRLCPVLLRRTVTAMQGRWTLLWRTLTMLQRRWMRLQRALGRPGRQLHSRRELHLAVWEGIQAPFASPQRPRSSACRCLPGPAAHTEAWVAAAAVMASCAFRSR